MSNKVNLKEYLRCGVENAYEGRANTMELKDERNPLQLPLMALAQRIKVERQCVSDRSNIDEIITGGKCALCLEDQVERESGLRLGEYDPDNNDFSTTTIGSALAERGDYVNLLFVAARSNPNDEIQSRLIDLMSRGLANYANHMESIANGDGLIMERIRITRQASLELGN